MNKHLPITWERASVPVPACLAEKCVQLWAGTFGVSYEPFRPVLAGSEIEQHRNILFLARHEGRLIGTCQLTQSHRHPELGGLGEVVVCEEHRGRGIARLLCQSAIDEFEQSGGTALFLGTVNPSAEKLYRSLDWGRIVGTRAMIRTSNGGLAEEWLWEYLRCAGSVTIAPATPAIRLPVIPLALAPHPWQILDANVDLVSTRYAWQTSCMGLYPRYERVLGVGRGAIYAAWSGNDRLVGLSTVKEISPTSARIDGFACHRAISAVRDLLAAAAQWAKQRGYQEAVATITETDEEKRAICESLGLRQCGPGEPIRVAGEPVPTTQFLAHIAHHASDEK